MVDETADRQPLREKVQMAERDHIMAALAVNYGCVAAAARWLAMPVSTLRWTMRKYKIDPNEFRR